MCEEKNMHRNICVIVGLLLLASRPTSIVAAEEPDFARDVRPLLSQYCFKCHGPDEKTREGGLRLDVRTSALTGGDSKSPTVVPGKSSSSELIKRITSSDPDTVMPPPSTKRHLTPEQIDLLKRWIDAGATYAEHWAFQPLTSAKVTIAQPQGVVRLIHWSHSMLARKV